MPLSGPSGPEISESCLEIATLHHQPWPHFVLRDRYKESSSRTHNVLICMCPKTIQYLIIIKLYRKYTVYTDFIHLSATLRRQKIISKNSEEATEQHLTAATTCGLTCAGKRSGKRPSAQQLEQLAPSKWKSGRPPLAVPGIL